MNERDQLLNHIRHIEEECEKEIYFLKRDYNNGRNIYDRHSIDEYDERIYRIEQQKRKMVQELIERFNQEQTPPKVLNEKSETKSDIGSAIDDLYKKLKIKDSVSVDVIVRRVGGKYVAEVDKHRDHKINEIFADDK